MAEKLFEKIQHLLMVKIPRKPGIEENFLNTMKDMYKNLQLILSLVSKGYALLFNMILDVLTTE